MGGLDGVRRGRVHFTFDTFGERISPIFTPNQGWLLVLGLTALWNSISVYFEASPTERVKKRETTEERKMSKQPQPAATASAGGPCPNIIQISRTPWHCEFTQHHRTTRPDTPSLPIPIRDAVKNFTRSFFNERRQVIKDGWGWEEVGNRKIQYIYQLSC